MGQHPHRFGPKALAVAALLLGLAAEAAAAEKFPAWAEEFARRDVSAWRGKTSAVVLHESGQLELLPAGRRFRYQGQMVMRVLRPSRDGGQERVVVSFDSDERIVSLQAWTRQPQGKVLRLDPKLVVEESDFSSYDLYSDVRYRHFIPPGLVPDSVIAYEYTLEGIYRVPMWRWVFGWGLTREVPNLESSFTLRLPPGGRFRWRTYNLEPVDVEEGELQTSWRAVNLEPIRWEENMPPMGARLPQLVVNFAPPGEPLLESWDDVAAWFWKLYESRAQITPEIRSQAAELVAGVEDPREKVRRLVEFVQRQVRYVAIEIGIGGYQPHPSPQVLHHRYGDCKDKATLLAALLSVEGFEAYPVLIGTRGEIEVDPEFPTLHFNHVILALRAEGPWTEAWRKELAFTPEPGLLWVDATSERAALGYLPGSDQGVHALVVGPDRGRLIETPRLEPQQNGYERRIEARLDAAGSLQAVARETYLGQQSLDWKSYLANQPAMEALEVFEERFSHTGAGRLADLKFENLDSNQGDFVAHYRYQAPDYVTHLGQLRLLRPIPLSRARIYEVAEEKRTQPLDFKAGVTERDEVEFWLPAGWRLEEKLEPLEIKSEFGSYRLDWEVRGSILKVSRQFRLQEPRIPLEKVPAYRDFIRQVIAADAGQLIFRAVP